jgi:cytochrome c oxidase cbb3-type subunit 3
MQPSGHRPARSPPGGPPRARILRACLATAGALLLLVAALWWRHQAALGNALVRAYPDAIPGDPALETWALARGRRAYARHCSSCHGAAGEGDRQRGVPDLRDGDWLYGSGRVLEVERVVLYGIRAENSKGWRLSVMPGYARREPDRQYRLEPLRPSEIDDVTEYLMKLQGQPYVEAVAARGALVYRNQSRGLCWDCHAENARGNPAIGAPRLTDGIWLYGDGSRAAIRRSIADGRAGVCPAWVGRLDAVTIRALAVWVHQLSAQAPSNTKATKPQ